MYVIFLNKFLEAGLSQKGVFCPYNAQKHLKIGSLNIRWCMVIYI